MAHAVQICHGDVWFHFGRPLRELKLKLAFPSGPCMDGMEDVPLLVCVVLVARWCVCVWVGVLVRAWVRACVCCVLCVVGLCVYVCRYVGGLWVFVFIVCLRVCLCVFRYFIYISRHFICVSRYFLCAFEHLYAFPDTANETVPKANTIHIPYLHT